MANDFNTDNFVYLNNGNDPFRIAGNRIDLLEEGSSIGGSWGNYDHDGDLDLLLVTQPTQDNFLYENTLSQTGTAALNLKDPANDSAPDPFPMNSDGGNSWGCSWADYDNDKDLDLLTANHEGLCAISCIETISQTEIAGLISDLRVPSQIALQAEQKSGSWPT